MKLDPLEDEANQLLLLSRVGDLVEQAPIAQGRLDAVCVYRRARDLADLFANPGQFGLDVAPVVLRFGESGLD